MPLAHSARHRWNASPLPREVGRRGDPVGDRDPARTELVADCPSSPQVDIAGMPATPIATSVVPRRNGRPNDGDDTPTVFPSAPHAVANTRRRVGIDRQKHEHPGPGAFEWSTPADAQMNRVRLRDHERAASFARRASPPQNRPTRAGRARRRRAGLPRSPKASIGMTRPPLSRPPSGRAPGCRPRDRSSTTSAARSSPPGSRAGRGRMSGSRRRDTGDAQAGVRLVPAVQVDDHCGQPSERERSRAGRRRARAPTHHGSFPRLRASAFAAPSSRRRRACPRRRAPRVVEVFAAATECRPATSVAATMACTRSARLRPSGRGQHHDSSPKRMPLGNAAERRRAERLLHLGTVSSAASASTPRSPRRSALRTASSFVAPGDATGAEAGRRLARRAASRGRTGISHPSRRPPAEQPRLAVHLPVPPRRHSHAGALAESSAAGGPSRRRIVGRTRPASATTRRTPAAELDGGVVLHLRGSQRVVVKAGRRSRRRAQAMCRRRAESASGRPGPAGRRRHRRAGWPSRRREHPVLERLARSSPHTPRLARGETPRRAARRGQDHRTDVKGDSARHPEPGPFGTRRQRKEVASSAGGARRSPPPARNATTRRASRDARAHWFRRSRPEARQRDPRLPARPRSPHLSDSLPKGATVATSVNYRGGGRPPAPRRRRRPSPTVPSARHLAVGALRPGYATSSARDRSCGERMPSRSGEVQPGPSRSSATLPTPATLPGAPTARPRAGTAHLRPRLRGRQRLRARRAGERRAHAPCVVVPAARGAARDRQGDPRHRPGWRPRRTTGRAQRAAWRCPGLRERPAVQEELVERECVHVTAVAGQRVRARVRTCSHEGVGVARVAAGQIGATRGAGAVSRSAAPPRARRSRRPPATPGIDEWASRRSAGWLASARPQAPARLEVAAASVREHGRLRKRNAGVAGGAVRRPYAARCSCRGRRRSPAGSAAPGGSCRAGLRDVGSSASCAPSTIRGRCDPLTCASRTQQTATRRRTAFELHERVHRSCLRG